MVEALKRANVTGNSAQIAEDRQRVRDEMAAITNADDGIEGISGLLYFDARGDAQQVPTIGVLERNKLTPAFNQLTPITIPKSRDELRQGVANGEVVQFGGQFLNRTDIVYTGVRPKSIYEINLEEETFQMDFDIWFRYRSSLSEGEIANIRFLNAATEVSLEEPFIQTEEGGITYALYQLSGKFYLDFLNPENRGLGEHILGLSFVNERLGRSRLVYVTDSVGLNLNQSFPFEKRLETEQVLTAEPDWKIIKATFFQGLAQQELLSNPITLTAADESFEFAQFNLMMTIASNDLSLRRTLRDNWAVYLLAVSAFIFIFLLIQRQYERMKLSNKIQWVLRAASVLTFLFAAETLMVDWLENLIPIGYLELVVRAFDVLWWLIPTYLLAGFIDCFLWEPLSQKTGHAIPSLIHRMVLFVIYLIAFFCIVAYVFNRPLTSLLATSGIILTIIGLAIQINISNIFAGLAINLEKTFKVGDYIEIPNKRLKGHVVDINWRATRIQTRDQNIIVVPNSEINNETIVNYVMPQDNSRATIVFKLDSDVPPQQASKVLNQAIQAVTGKGKTYPLATPTPYVIIGHTDIYGVDYWIRCWYVPKDVSEDTIRDVVTRSVLEHLQMAEIPLASHKASLVQETEVNDNGYVSDEIEAFSPISSNL